MIRLPYVKLGTMPFGPARVRNKKHIPKVGDIIYIREDNPKKTIYTNPWKKVRVDLIKEEKVCFFVSGV